MKNSKAFLNSFKTKYMVTIRPIDADCSHVDNVYVKAFGLQDAMNRVDAAVDHLEYAVQDIIPAGNDLFGINKSCSCVRASVKDIGIADEFFGITFN
jgi:hypothetical protein